MTDNTAPQNAGSSTDWRQGIPAEFEGRWKLWASDAGIRYATRTRNLTGEELFKGLSQTVAAETDGGLIDKLREQQQKENDLAAKRRARSA